MNLCFLACRKIRVSPGFVSHAENIVGGSNDVVMKFIFCRRFCLLGHFDGKDNKHKHLLENKNS